MTNEINVDLWIDCSECLIEDKDSNFGTLPREEFTLGIGLEIESNSLIVHCFRHNKNIKLFRLSEEEIELIPEECDECTEKFGENQC